MKEQYKNPEISIIIPAHNEENYIADCFRSIKAASVNYTLEIIVILNRCTDTTEKIALSYGAIIVKSNSKNLSKIRNCGVTKSSGEIIVTVDADSIMSLNMLDEIVQAIKFDNYIGGGVLIKPERTSLGIKLTDIFLKFVLFFMGVSAGSLWCRRKDFDKINGFDENLLIAEDLDFAKRLKQYGKLVNKKFKTIRTAHINTSCRKFDKYGDWHWFKFMLFKPRKLLRGDKDFANEYFYDFEE